MTGQIDEAGRGVEAVIALLRATGNPKAAAEVAGLRTQLAERDSTIERQKASLLRYQKMYDRQDDLAAKYAQAAIDYRDQRDVAEGQVAAIRALHGKVPEPFLDGERYSCSTCTDGEGNAIDWPCPTLVASSPTTPEADS